MENELHKNGYKVIKGLIDPKVYFDHMQKLSKEEKFRRDDASLFVYKDSKFEQLLADLIPAVEAHADCRVFKTYSFGRHYRKGDVLPAHTDRFACEISLTICLGNEDQPWPLGIMNRDESPQSIVIEPGDAIMYKGVEMLHWRERNIYGNCSKLFLHYVDQNGPYAMCRDDKPLKEKRSLFPFLRNLIGRKRSS